MISMEKTYRTRDGREVRLYAADGGGAFPVHGAANCDGYWIAHSWSMGGHSDLLSLDCQPADLIEVKAKHEGWVNIYPSSVQYLTAFTTNAFATEEDANEVALDCRLACVRISWDA